MKKRHYPAVLERGPKGSFGTWLPDFPGCVAGGRSQEEAIAKAENALAHAVDALAEQDRGLPEPTPIDQIVLPRGCELVAYFMVGVEPPDPSERVNVYLPKSLIGRIDKRAAELGMSRSSFFGLAVSITIDRHFTPPFGIDVATPRSKVRNRGSVTARKKFIRKPSP